MTLTQLNRYLIAHDFSFVFTPRTVPLSDFYEIFKAREVHERFYSPRFRLAVWKPVMFIDLRAIGIIHQELN